MRQKTETSNTLKCNSTALLLFGQCARKHAGLAAMTTLCFHRLNAWSQTTHACGCRVLLGHGSHPAQEKKHLRQAVTPLLPSDRTSLGWARKDASSSHSLASRTTPNRPCRIALTRSTTKENDEYTHTHCSLRSRGCRSCGVRPKDRKRCHVICLTRFYPPKHSLSSRPGAAVRILRLKNRASTN